MLPTRRLGKLTKLHVDSIERSAIERGADICIWEWALRGCSDVISVENVKVRLVAGLEKIHRTVCGSLSIKI